MNLIEQVESIAQISWENHPASQPAKLGDVVEACVIVEDLFQVLLKHPTSSRNQILGDVYVYPLKHPDISLPSIKVTIHREAVPGFIKQPAPIHSISFETHPEWTKVEGAANLRWLIITGWYPDDNSSTKWTTEYTFGNFDIRKQERIFEEDEWRTINANAVLGKSDLDIIRNVLFGIQDQVVPALPI